MAAKRRYLDVWIVESNTVYKEVPFTVVVDWVQQGRLLEDDMLRWSGQKDWFRLGDTQAFAAYVPRADPLQANDQAEALEPVQVDFQWKRRHDEDEGDVDMIPLIDVSLVLLIFFMMTTSSAVSGFFVNTPAADNGWVTSDPLAWVALDFKHGEDGKPDKQTLVYTLGQGDNIIGSWETPDTDKDRSGVIAKILHDLEEKSTPVELNIKADDQMPSGYVRDLTRALEGIRAKVTRKYIGVSEKGAS